MKDQLSRVDYENRMIYQDSVRNSIVLGYACAGSYYTKVHGAVTLASSRVRIVIDCSHNPTYNTVSSYSGAYKLKMGFDVSQNCIFKFYEGAHIPAFTANKITTRNFNRIMGDAACVDVSVNVLDQFAVATETSGNLISQAFIHAPSASGVGGTKTESIGNQGSEYSFILHPQKKYLIDIQNTTGSTSVTNVNFRLVREPNIPTS